MNILSRIFSLASKKTTIYDNTGKIIGHECTYKENGHNIRIIEKEGKNKLGTDIKRTVKFVDGKVDSFTTRTNLWGYNEKGFLYAENTMFRNSNKECQKLIYKKGNSRPQIIQWTTNWDGNIPTDIKYDNIGQIYDNIKGLEYLPVITNRQSFNRFKHMFQYNLKKHHIEDIFDDFGATTREDIRSRSKELEDFDKTLEYGVGGYFDSDKTGALRVRVSDKRYTTRDDAEIIAHECMHAKDYSDMCRLLEAQNSSLRQTDFYEKSRKKGIISLSLKYPKPYKRIKDLFNTAENGDYYNEVMEGNHSKIKTEISANEEGAKESDLLFDVWKHTLRSFGFDF